MTDYQEGLRFHTIKIKNVLFTGFIGGDGPRWMRLLTVSAPRNGPGSAAAPLFVPITAAIGTSARTTSWSEKSR